MTITQRLEHVERSMEQSRGWCSDPAVIRRLLEIFAADEGMTPEEYLADLEARRPYPDIERTSFPEFIRQVAEREGLPALEIRAEVDRMIEEARASLALEAL